MAELPSASVVIDDEAGAFAGATGFLVVLGCVGKNADAVPRVFASTKSLLSQHDYAPAVDFCAMHFEEAGTPVIFCGLPAATIGTLGREDSTGVLGSSAISAAAAPSGIFEEVDAVVTVVKGGTVGTDLVTFTLSLDGGRSEKLIRLGTNNSYTIPYVGVVLNFGAGILNAGDVFTFSTTAPMWNSDGLSSARDALAAQQKLARSWMVIGELPEKDFAGYVTTEANGYETENDRFIYARASVRDRLPIATAAKITKRMTGTPSLTFAASGDTITRSAGSFVDDGFAIGDVATVVGGTTNDGFSGKITVLTDTVMTFAAGIADEGPITNATITGSPGFVFDAGADTITRSQGSWFADGFREGDSVTVDDSASNDGTRTITDLSSTVMTFASGLADETVRSDEVTITKGETVAAWVAAMDAEFADVDGEKRIDLSLGRGRKQSPITGWLFRRPSAWAASLREYQHDLMIPNWRKVDGPCSGWDLKDDDQNLVEYDERVDGGALAARFTCFRTWPNGPNGAFIALSLTRATEGSLLSRTHNMSVANLACSVVQAETENAIGQVLVLNDDGTATDDSRKKIEERVNSALDINLLSNRLGEGKRASKAVWRMSPSDVLNTVPATATGTLELELNGTLEKITTRVRVQTGG